MDVYAVIDGEIVAVNPWEGDATYQYEGTDWYSQAVAAEGQIVRGDAYLDAITGQRIFTISKSLTIRKMCWHGCLSPERGFA